MSRKYAYVMMIRDKWWNEFHRRLHAGKQVHSYVRVGLAPPRDAKLIFFYLVKPVGEIVAYADFIERKAGDSEEMWMNYGGESALKTKEQYEEFVGGKKEVSFIRFRNLQEAANPIGLNDFLMLLGMKRLSRKGFYVDKEVADKLVMRMC